MRIILYIYIFLFFFQKYTGADIKFALNPRKKPICRLQHRVDLLQQTEKKEKMILGKAEL